MLGKELRAALLSGRRVYGTLIVSPSPKWPEAVGRCGLDFVFIDTEHVALDREKLSWMCHTYRAMGIAPIVRILAPDPFQATMMLDAGASGIIAPYIETAAQVRALAGAVKLRPVKGSYLQNKLHGTAEFPGTLQEYLDQVNGGNVLVVNIESVPAMEALDEILAVPGLDAVLIGPHDLTCSLGIPEQYDHPRFKEAVSQIIKKAREAGKGAGIHYSFGLAEQMAWIKEGANLVVHSSDITLFSEALRRDLQALRQMAE
ncbi:MAG TPA: aldolase [Firmicutes bacterium]|nr:aldolase [Bacillota bacterium]